MSFTIENKVALVTGANRGIGKAIVESFVNHGAKKVYLAVRDISSTKELEAKYGNKVVTLKADVSSTAAINELAKQANDVDIVVNNAGIGTPYATIGKDVEEDFTAQLQVNAFGLLRIANAFAQQLEEKKGALVQLNSIASLKNFSQLSTYSASKAASYSLTQGLRTELGAKGVTVLSVHPGPIDTDMSAAAGFEGAAATTEVSEGIITALKAGDFHLFPDAMAKQVESAYQSFSDAIVLADF
ncbi:short-chain dehydrogenase/reductase SDR [Cellulophaga algicola DSM 14237]|uniref:Short-chain dehydrogenase/reductase SDR n=1 Tax=Cellulophaga algicola (strain DSM 14237 / IC166 / ACAM 630) TaxID=688270 RepID=E6X9U3_CELAD|nr:SDR family oxidoreductase [Cellulophaga algicola]ADV49863.1 short-chain dehydrogenase/reductase SDR [Cellulophaga algicola DSM 14237]